MNSDLTELGGDDPHALLGVPRGASPDQVAQAFRQRAKGGGHPDTGGDAHSFRRLVRARDVLLDSGRLAAYDAALRTNLSPGGSGGPAHQGVATPTDSYRNGSDPGREGATEAAPAQQGGAEVGYEPAGVSWLAIAAVALAVLCPVLWPVAIVVGLLALGRIKRTGQRGSTLVWVMLLLLGLLSICVLPRIILVMLATNT